MDKTVDDDFFAYDQSETKIIKVADGTLVKAIFGKIKKTETSWDGSTVSDTREIFFKKKFIGINRSLTKKLKFLKNGVWFFSHYTVLGIIFFCFIFLK